MSRKSRVFRLSRLNALSCIAHSCSEGEQICNDDLAVLAKAVAVALGGSGEGPQRRIPKGELR